MNQTADQRHKHLLNTLQFMINKNGWEYHKDLIFKSPSGTFHDLSAADLTQLDRIEKERLFMA